MKLTKALTCFFFCVSILSSCTNEDLNEPPTLNGGNPNDETSLNGTWTAEITTTSFDLATDTEIGNRTTYSTVIFNENAADIDFYTCFSFIDQRIPEKLVTQSNQLQFVDIDSPPFTIIEKNKKLTRLRQEIIGSQKIIHQELYIKSSNSFPPNNSSFRLNGPITANSGNQVCFTQYLEHGLNPAYDLYYYQLEIPFQDNVLRLNIDTRVPLRQGSYQFDMFSIASDPIISDFSIFSNADIFFNTTGGNVISADLVDFVITSYQENSIEGTFMFTDRTGGDYSGSFNFIPHVAY